MTEWIESYRAIPALIGLVVILSAMAWMVASYGFRQFRKQGIVFSVISFLFLNSMATKPSAPRVQWDDYLANDGTHYITNNVAKVGVNFKWRKTLSALPDSEVIHISCAPTNTETWTTVGTALVGDRSYLLTLNNPDGYNYYVWHDWIPPTPVHTNGVWLGTVIEKAKGTTGVDKMIIINGELRKNGKVIAP